MNLIPSDIDIPFKFQRRQFSITLCFAMTINKSQGRSLSKVGLYLPRPVKRSKQGEAKVQKGANGSCCIEVINSVTSATIVPLQAG